MSLNGMRWLVFTECHHLVMARSRSFRSAVSMAACAGQFIQIEVDDNVDGDETQQATMQSI